MPEHDNNEVLTEKEAASLLKVSLRTVQNWRYDKNGPPYTKIGGTIRYRRSEVLAWLSREQVSSSK